MSQGPDGDCRVGHEWSYVFLGSCDVGMPGSTTGYVLLRGVGSSHLGLSFVHFMFERVVFLCPQDILDPPRMRDPILVRWGKLLPHQGGGKVGYYFTCHCLRGSGGRPHRYSWSTHTMVLTSDTTQICIFHQVKTGVIEVSLLYFFHI
jgi:hypothetical protein